MLHRSFPLAILGALFFLFSCTQSRGLPAALSISAAAILDSKISVSWTLSSSDGVVSSFLIAAAADPILPDCASPSTIVLGSASSTVLEGLTPDTLYNIAVCAARSDGVAGAPVTVQRRTLKTCDHTLVPGSLDAGSIDGISFSATADGFDSFDEFEGFLAAYNTQVGSGATKSVCLADNLMILNSNALNGDMIVLNGSHWRFWGGTNVTISNQRNNHGTDGSYHLAIMLVSSVDTSIDNVTFLTAGQNGIALNVQNNSALTLTNSTLSTAATNAVGLYVNDGSSAVVDHVTINTQGLSALGVTVYQTSTLTADHLSVDTKGDDAHAISTSSSAAFSLSNTTLKTSGFGADGMSVRGAVTL